MAGKLVSALAVLLAALAWPVAAMEDSETMAEDTPQWSIAIHGGAGVIERGNMTPEKEAEIRAALQSALDGGAAILKQGGSAIDAITATITALENDPNFNAGRGAVMTWNEGHELDASIMDGRDRSAGAVAGTHYTKNPILLARAVKEKSPHVMLSGEGADQFSKEQGLEQVEQSYFTTPYRKSQIERMKAEKLSALDVEFKYGTVGAVALDSEGNMAAGTSTGGMTGKRWGRIGDSPIIGAGTYADDRACAVSATGWGEYFIRVGVAHEICSRIRTRFALAMVEAQESVPRDKDGHFTYAIHASEMQLEAQEIRDIADEVMEEVKWLGGDGGVIVVTPWGHAEYSFNTAGMYRGRANSEGLNEVAIYGDE